MTRSQTTRNGQVASAEWGVQINKAIKISHSYYEYERMLNESIVYSLESPCEWDNNVSFHAMNCIVGHQVLSLSVRNGKTIIMQHKKMLYVKYNDSSN